MGASHDAEVDREVSESEAGRLPPFVNVTSAAQMYPVAIFADLREAIEYCKVRTLAEADSEEARVYIHTGLPDRSGELVMICFDSTDVLEEAATRGVPS